MNGVLVEIRVVVYLYLFPSSSFDTLFWKYCNIDGERPPTMMLLPPCESRRSLILSTLLLWNNPCSSNKKPITLEDWSTFICDYTPREVRAAVQTTGRFLYRGASASVARMEIDHPEPDLLLPETYDDSSALTYFQCLEQTLISKARPSTGHITTSTATEAGRWGPVVSVWPLGDSFSYVWPQDRSTLFPGGNCGAETLVVDRGLTKALEQDREILFYSDFSQSPRIPSGISRQWRSAYITIPRDQDGELYQLLQKKNFGL